MAQCIISGIAEGGIDPKRMWISAPSEKNLNGLQGQGYNVTHQNIEVAKKCNVIFICVKPHLVDVVAAEIKGSLSPQHLVISVAAAVKISHLTGDHPLNNHIPLERNKIPIIAMYF